MRVALCQVDTTVGDFAGNVQRILVAGAEAGSRESTCAGMWVVGRKSVCASSTWRDTTALA